MSELNNILPSYLDKATAAEKQVFFQALICLAGIDGYTHESEIDFITQAAQRYNIENLDSLCNFSGPNEVIENIKVIQDRHLAMELVREMCMLSHADSVLSDEETLFIGRIGLALGLEIEKIEQISNWVIDRIIWLEQAKIIFEEDK
ncbi:MAG: TerB family tellurite resistance protein [Alphaproteobacteria bacterium]|nr:TerB family tellurite resistance protein [Alphaproteobacteria bacterium]